MKFLLYHANISLQIDAAVNTCSEQCVKKNIELVLKKISELEESVRQLDRRARTLWSQKIASEQERKYIKVAYGAMRKSLDNKNFKLRKAQMLNHFLQNELKKLDKNVFLEFMARNVGL